MNLSFCKLYNLKKLKSINNNNKIKEIRSNVNSNMYLNQLNKVQSISIIINFIRKHETKKVVAKKKRENLKKKINFLNSQNVLCGCSNLNFKICQKIGRYFGYSEN